MCTNFSLFNTGANNTYVVTARTMDFSVDLQTKVALTPRGQSFPDAQTTPATNALT